MLYLRQVNATLIIFQLKHSQPANKSTGQTQGHPNFQKQWHIQGGGVLRGVLEHPPKPEEYNQ